MAGVVNVEFFFSLLHVISLNSPFMVLVQLSCCTFRLHFVVHGYYFSCLQFVVALWC